MKFHPSVTIHFGASTWEATVDGVHYDFRKMNYDQKKLWYGTFMDAVRVKYGKPQPKRRVSERRPRSSRLSVLSLAPTQGKYPSVSGASSDDPRWLRLPDDPLHARHRHKE